MWWRPAAELRQHFFLRTKDLYSSAAEDKNRINSIENARSMRDDDSDPTPSANTDKRQRQRFFSVGVEIRIGFV
jgi:hypothetical protein